MPPFHCDMKGATTTTKKSLTQTSETDRFGDELHHDCNHHLRSCDLPPNTISMIFLFYFVCGVLSISLQIKFDVCVKKDTIVLMRTFSVVKADAWAAIEWKFDWHPEIWTTPPKLEPSIKVQLCLVLTSKRRCTTSAQRNLCTPSFLTWISPPSIQHERVPSAFFNHPLWAFLCHCVCDIVFIF